MKKVVYIITLAVGIAMAACSTSDESSEASSNSANSNVNKTVAPTLTSDESVVPDASDSALDLSNNPTSPAGGAQQPNGNQANAPQPTQSPKAPFTPEEKAKYKEAIDLVNTYKEEVNKCFEAKTSGKVIDEATKQRITEIQNKLNELEKEGKMNKTLIELRNASDNFYKGVITK